MKVFGHTISVTTRQVLTLLAEKNTDAELVLVDVFAQEQKKPSHVARHPFGHIPVLEDDGFWLYETPAILRYLESKLPTPSLTPRDLHERARMDQWLCIEQAYLQSAMKKLFAREGAKLFKQPDPGPEIVDAGKADLAGILDVMARQLSAGSYLAGPAFSLADLVWLTYVPHMIDANCSALIEQRPLIADWWDRVRGRPAWIATLDRLGVGRL